MYTPSFNKFTDDQEIVSFMQRYSFATLISVQDGTPLATHLPFVVKYEDEKIILLSHLAKVNPQSASIIGKDVLVIFMEPHAYISPKNYDKHESVPTWNYLAVHAYGKCILIDGPEKKAGLLEQTIKFYEQDYLAQWESISNDYKLRMMNGIIAFEIIVSNMQARKKLSQEKPEPAKARIINDLNNSGNTLSADIAGYMSGE